jgi:hypothetical protein
MPPQRSTTTWECAQTSSPWLIEARARPTNCSKPLPCQGAQAAMRFFVQGRGEMPAHMSSPWLIEAREAGNVEEILFVITLRRPSRTSK